MLSTMIAGRSLRSTRLSKPQRRAPQTGSGRIAQLVEQLTLNQRVLGSSPSASTKISLYISNLGKSKILARTGAAPLGSSLGSRGTSSYLAEESYAWASPLAKRPAEWTDLRCSSE